ncbi:hypothetical protein M514_06811 [Trichuris suis]|uniref:EGF-like domain-containing protein n=1 Tax=Trichuris suis TaxID=68888 RepID=A0A085NB65_9BILA|nr:hypothetical protein M513_06811 [Trichuris suis]KFD66711.1 hypothetical protein M514_06811 [Trichuris suis]
MGVIHLVFALGCLELAFRRSVGTASRFGDQCVMINFPRKIFENSTVSLPSGWPATISCPVNSDPDIKVCWWWWISVAEGKPKLLKPAEDTLIYPGRDLEFLTVTKAFDGHRLICAMGRTYWTYLLQVIDCTEGESLCEDRGTCITMHEDGAAPVVACKCITGYGQFCERTLPDGPFQMMSSFLVVLVVILASNIFIQLSKEEEDEEEKKELASTEKPSYPRLTRKQTYKQKSSPATSLRKLGESLRKSFS